MAGWLSELKTRRDHAVSMLNTAPGLRYRTPEGAFYLFVNWAAAIGKCAPDNRVISSDRDLANYLLDSVCVGTVSGSAFGASPYLRIAYAVDRAILINACDRIVKACRDLR